MTMKTSLVYDDFSSCRSKESDHMEGVLQPKSKQPAHGRVVQITAPRCGAMSTYLIGDE